MNTSNQIIGKRGEEEACSFLTGLGQRIVCRNWRSGHLELDIITLEGRVLHIVEVKTRSGDSPVAPESKVDFVKRKRLIWAAEAFLNATVRAGLPSGLEVQFDIVSVVFREPAPEIEYYPQAFIPLFY